MKNEVLEFLLQEIVYFNDKIKKTKNEQIRKIIYKDIHLLLKEVQEECERIKASL